MSDKDQAPPSIGNDDHLDRRIETALAPLKNKITVLQTEIQRLASDLNEIRSQIDA